MTVVVPGNNDEVDKIVKKSVDYPGPMYIRLGKSSNLNYKIGNLQVGRALILEQGKDIAIISNGNLLSLAKEVTNQLKKYNISCNLINMVTVKPLDVDLILKLTRRVKGIFVIEDNCVVGGLGSAVSEVLSEMKNKVIFRRFGLPDFYHKFIGKREFLLEKYGLFLDNLTNRILRIIKGKSNENRETN
jgi:transketolase